MTGRAIPQDNRIAHTNMEQSKQAKYCFNLPNNVEMLTHINRISIMALKLPVPAQIAVTTHSPTNLLNLNWFKCSAFTSLGSKCLNVDNVKWSK